MEINSKDRVQVIDRALDILEFLAITKGSTVPEISNVTGYPLPTVYRILHNLERREWVIKDVDGKKYAIGPKCSIVGSAHNLIMMLISEFHNEMEQLSNRYQETISLGVRIGSTLQYVHQARFFRPIQVRVPLHTPLPLHSTASGKVLLSGMKDENLLLMFQSGQAEPVTKNTVVDFPSLIGQINQIRRDGYVLELGESVIGNGCISVPLFFDKKLVATLTFTGVEINKLIQLKEEMLHSLIEVKKRFQEKTGQMQFVHGSKESHEYLF